MPAENTLLSTNQLPIIDFSVIDFGGERNFAQNREISKILSIQLREAIANTGLALLINHGISQNKIQEAWNNFDKFLQLPTDIKNKYKRLRNSRSGLSEPGTEVLDKNKQELRYSFDICKFSEEIIPKEIPGFIDNLNDLSKDLKSLTNLLLESIALALDMPINFFTENHKKTCKNINNHDENISTLRLLYYPPVTCEPSENYIRCGAHKDYGTFTLLSQDSEGGLEIKLPGKGWQRVGFLPGSLLINCGEILSFWTRNRYPAVNHRVVIPNETDLQKRGRHSMAFFVHPDGETMIRPSDIPYPGNESEIPEDEICNANEHLEKRFNESYLY